MTMHAGALLLCAWLVGAPDAVGTAAPGPTSTPSADATGSEVLPSPQPPPPPPPPSVEPGVGDPVMPPPPSRPPPRVVALRLALAAPEPGELERLESYVQDVLGSPVGPGLVAEVSRRLDLLGRYGAPMCRTEPIDAERVSLACTVRRARVLRRVTFDTNIVTDIDGIAVGLPLAILENELRKRVLLRPGEPIDDDDVLGRGRIARQRQRIEDFLEREGYFGARVIVEVGEPDENGEVDVRVRVGGGSFVRVRRVLIQGFGPLSQNRLRDAFSSMCLTPEGLIDGVFIGNVKSCFNRRRLQGTIDQFTAELREAGFPEARIRVTPTFIDAKARNDIDGCAFNTDQIREMTRARLPIPPRCVDLTVDVVPGRHIVSRFHLEDGELVRYPPGLEGTARWLRETFGEPASRTWQLTFNNPVRSASDTAVVEQDLRSRLTFDAAGSVDETEAELSAELLRDYLNGRGYPSPEAKVRYVEYEDGSVAVDYTITTGAPTPTKSVRFVGNRTMSSERILDEVELAARPRTGSTAGFVTTRALDDDVTRLRAWYARQGFSEADVSVHAVRDTDGAIEVVFVIDEGERFLVSEVVLAGGAPELSEAVLKAIAHCGGTAETPRDPLPKTGRDCRGNPLLPDEFDADARRVEAIYAGNGYPDAAAQVELGFGAEGPIVRVSVFPWDATGEARSDPRPGNVTAVKLGEIFVEGNLQTSRDVLLREMGLDALARGSRLNPDKIAIGVSRLRRTGLFSRVDVQLIGLDDRDDTAHVRVTVEERPSSTVDLSLGFSTQQLLSLRLEGRDRNLFGTMFDGSAVVDMGLFIGRFSQVRNQIRWPRMFGSDLSLSYTPIALSYLDQPANVILQAPSTSGGQKASASWDQPDSRRRLFSLGTTVALDWRAAHLHPLIDDKLTVGVALEARGDWLQVAGPYIRPLSLQALQTVDGLTTLFDGPAAVDPTTIFSVTPRVAYSTIDNPFDPKSGIGAELFFRTVPFAQTPWGVVGAQTRGYRSFLGDRLTLAANARLRVGVVGVSDRCPVANERCEWALMQTDLLQLGGERSVRGTKENQVGVPGTRLSQDLSVVVDDDGQPVIQARQGLIGANANVELRFTLVRQLFLGDLKPAVFADIAYSADELPTQLPSADTLFSDTRYAVSIGTGLRYVLPVGPLAFDLAWSPFDVEREPFRLSVTLGYIF
jgi:outer membrane protein insertion porin family